MGRLGTDCRHYRGDGRCPNVTHDGTSPTCPHVGQSNISCEVVELEDGGYVHHVAVNDYADHEYHLHFDETGEDTPVAAAEEKPRRQLSNQEFLDQVQKRHQRRSRR